MTTQNREQELRCNKHSNFTRQCLH